MILLVSILSLLLSSSSLTPLKYRYIWKRRPGSEHRVLETTGLTSNGALQSYVLNIVRQSLVSNSLLRFAAILSSNLVALITFVKPFVYVSMLIYCSRFAVNVIISWILVGLLLQIVKYSNTSITNLYWYTKLLLNADQDTFYIYFIQNVIKFKDKNR